MLTSKIEDLISDETRAKLEIVRIQCVFQKCLVDLYTVGSSAYKVDNGGRVEYIDWRDAIKIKGSKND